MIASSSPAPFRFAEVTSPPFAVTETGWGAFDIQITITMKDPAVPPIYLIHKLRLYPADNSPLSLDKPVVDDHYDEIVFNSLPADAKAKDDLVAGPKKKQPAFTYSQFLPDYSAAEDLARVNATALKIQKDATIMKDRLLRRREESAKMTQDLRTLGLTL